MKSSLLLLLACLWGSCVSQDRQEILTLTMDGILAQQSQILQKLDEQEGKIETQLQELQSRLALIEESQKSMKEIIGLRMEEVHKCVTRDQVDIFQNTSLTEFQNKLASIEESQTSMENIVIQMKEIKKCATQDQLEAFQNISLTEQQLIRSTLQQCSSEDQVNTLHEILMEDSCKSGRHNCSELATCIDIGDDYQCSCKSGYSGDGFTCQDINECELQLDACHDYATCKNTVGSYTCECLPYYDGNGYTCTVTGCSSPSKEFPSLGCILPVTQKMTWEDAQDNCHRRGATLVEGLTVQHIRLFKHYFPKHLGRPYPWVGHRGGIWVKSKKTVGSEEGLWQVGKPNGSHSKQNDCGAVNLDKTPPALYDIACSILEVSLCQFLYI